MSLRRLRLVWIVILPVTVAALYFSASDSALSMRRVALSAQLTPAVAGGLGAAALLWLVLALVWGRVFCSVGCPAGMVQEWFHRLGRRLDRRASGTARSRFVPASPLGIAVALAAGLAMLLVGGAWVADVVDPAGLFGRLTDPLAALWRRFILNQGMLAITPVMAAAGLLSFALFAIVPLFLGRWFCDRLCPAGACLGVAASIAPRRLTLSAADCVGCGLCARRCPARCIDLAAKTLDVRRCVLCLECRDVCPRQAIRFGPADAAVLSPSILTEAEKVVGSAPGPGETVPDSRVTSEALPVLPAITTDAVAAANRRAFILKAGAWAAAAVFLASRRSVDAWGAIALPQPPDAPMPPGAGDWTRYQARCVSCMSCARSCPAGIIQASPGGLAPRLSYENDYCHYDCVRCVVACPTGALQLGSPEEKKCARLGATEYFPSRCVVNARGTACGACAEVCPTHAVTMVQREEGQPTVPDFDARYCIGCGACYWACPERPRAFAIHGLARQEKADGVRDTGPAPNQIKPPDAQGLYDFPI